MKNSNEQKRRVDINKTLYTVKQSLYIYSFQYFILRKM